MAALPAGCWPLASHGDAMHDLVLVKLTDSALRAIEDYVANIGKNELTPPSIQFLSEDEGKISIPIPPSNGNSQPYSTTFRFGITSNSDLEGPQGSFQCLRVGSSKMHILGPLPSRMRIQANEDVYEATKHRMAIDVETQRSKFTRVIKPNQTDIGRKIRVKQHRPPPSRPAPTNPAVHQSNSSYVHQTNSQPYSNPLTTGINGYNGGGGGLYPNGANQNGNAAYNGLTHNRPPQPATKPVSTSDVQKRPIKERLIHLLAYKPYKKPELYNRVISEGIKDKEKSVIPKILQQISAIKDNCYHLNRVVWNDVNEDWPFYSEEERRILKRRKPQNLTPPLSSDSGHSPSPPPGKRLPAPNQTSASSIQPPNKKQRISLYKRPQDANKDSGERSPAALSNGYHSSTSMSGASSGERKNDSDDDAPPPQTSLTPTKNENGFSMHFGAGKTFLDAAPTKQNYQNSPNMDMTDRISAGKTSCSPLGKNLSPLQNGTQSLDKKSPDSTTLLSHSPPVNPNSPDTTDIPDFEAFCRLYTQITCSEQRRQYKSEFAAEYPEYRDLHSRIEAVKHKFSNLEERLKGETPGGPNHREIKRQIVNEYEKMQREGSHQRNMDKFKYLHMKLTHIKRLVMDYDRLQTTAY